MVRFPEEFKAKTTFEVLSEALLAKARPSFGNWKASATFASCCLGLNPPKFYGYA